MKRSPENPPSVTPLEVSCQTLVSALGYGLAAHCAALREERSGLRQADFEHVDLATWIGRVDGAQAVSLPAALKEYDCRANRLTLLALEQDAFIARVARTRQRYGANRIGVFIGTTVSGLDRTELAYAERSPDTQALARDFSYRCTHNGFAVTDFVRHVLALRGPAHSVLTACSSSAKVFAVAQRFISAGICDAAVVGGVDTLCLTTLYGFNALQLVSSRPCRPWDRERDGLSLGEAAGFALLIPASDATEIALLGCGESQDAHHLSAPHPHGLGAVLAMRRALQNAALPAEAIDYINLHGTATPANDASEDRAVVEVFGRATPCSSTKGWTGHTLGAAGIVEAIISCLCIEQSWLPVCLNTRQVDRRLSAGIVATGHGARIATVMSNAFGFGGSNCSLVFGRLTR